MTGLTHFTVDTVVIGECAAIVVADAAAVFA